METGSWKLLTGMTSYLGVEGEVGLGLALYNIQDIIQSVSSDTKQEILTCLLLPHLLPSLLDTPAAGNSLVRALVQVIPLMTSSQLNTLLHNACPSRRDLQLLWGGQSEVGVGVITISRVRSGDSGTFRNRKGQI